MGNGTLVSWVWDHKTDGGESGDYTIAVTISYTEENEFTAMGTYNLEFPTTDNDDGGFLGGMGWLLPVIVIIIIVVVAVVVIKVIRNRRAAEQTA